LQLYIPVKMITGKEKVLKYGNEYKFKTAPVDPNDPFRGKFIQLRFDRDITNFRTDKHWRNGEKIYVLLEKNTGGFAKIKSVSKKQYPDNTDFVKAEVAYTVFDKQIVIKYPFDKFFTEETKAPEIEKIYNSNNFNGEKPSYALVAVKNGDAVLKDLIINGISVKKIITQKNNN